LQKLVDDHLNTSKSVKTEKGPNVC